jgi:hypothetical protein
MPFVTVFNKIFFKMLKLPNIVPIQLWNNLMMCGIGEETLFAMECGCEKNVWSVKLRACGNVKHFIVINEIVEMILANESMSIKNAGLYTILPMSCGEDADINHTLSLKVHSLREERKWSATLVLRTARNTWLTWKR